MNIICRENIPRTCGNLVNGYEKVLVVPRNVKTFGVRMITQGEERHMVSRNEIYLSITYLVPFEVWGM